MDRIELSFNKKLYWIDIRTIQSLNEWYIEQENRLRQQIVVTNQ
jgi:hypothetical protein